jgi:hypothetical protein
VLLDEGLSKLIFNFHREKRRDIERARKIFSTDEMEQVHTANI